MSKLLLNGCKSLASAKAVTEVAIAAGVAAVDAADAAISHYGSTAFFNPSAPKAVIPRAVAAQVSGKERLVTW